MDIKADVRQGRLALLVKTLESLGPLQGYGSTHFGALVRIVTISEKCSELRSGGVSITAVKRDYRRLMRGKHLHRRRIEALQI